MKTLEKLLAEYKIRFKETEDIDDATYPFPKDYSVSNDFTPEIKWMGKGVGYMMTNCNGVVYLNGTWATAKITEKPERWVVKKDENHPMWEKFKDWWNRSNPYQTMEELQSNWIYCTSDLTAGEHLLKSFSNYQFLTLDQWAELFLDEPKVGDWVYIEDFDTGNNFVSQFIEPDREGWDVLQKLSPELSAMLEKEINQIRGR